ncbi:MAG: type I glyceraldehyde-3-phosphate dehydrogenase, partial [Candidatus Nomurabacteria bacterium]|nr:type I glyceraldehyde-3-phosphate dehydrogenase [Candidatus Nomurabacteria bacterium]
MDKKINVAINGFGRIGRSFFRLAFENENINIVAVNDLAPMDNLLYLLRYDTAQGYEDYVVDMSDDSFYVDGKKISFHQEKDPTQLPWKDLDIDVVVESTGFFTKYPDAKLHMDAGAKKVVISAPAKSEDGDVSGVKAQTVLMGVNHDQLGTCQLSSNGSCTTNSVGAIMQALIDTVGVENAMLSTIHGYTASQSLVD